MKLKILSWNVQVRMTVGKEVLLSLWFVNGRLMSCVYKKPKLQIGQHVKFTNYGEIDGLSGLSGKQALTGVGL